MIDEFTTGEEGEEPIAGLPPLHFKKRRILGKMISEISSSLQMSSFHIPSE